MSRELIIASSNTHKISEIKPHITGWNVLSLADIGFEDEIEETGKSFVENALIKVRTVYKKHSQGWVLAEDSGLVVDALDGLPGIYSARYPGVKNPSTAQFCNKILEEMKNVPSDQRSARFVCAMILISPAGQFFEVEETCEGEIALQMQGEQGFGYDPIFYYPPLGKTTAEISAAEKNEISHRGKALKKIIHILNEQQVLAQLKN
jgi:XTP/dITP diphosphohydrolase